MSKPKLLVLGYAQHGKDTVCDMLHREYGLRHVSSSLFCAERAVRPWLAQRGIVYSTLDECYADRGNHRPEWFNAIADYNSSDPARLGRELFAEYDIYCGLRNIVEFNALKKAAAFDVCLWVDRCEHVKIEPATSMTIPRDVADWVINNNHDLDYLYTEVRRAHHFVEVTMKYGSAAASV